MADLPASIQNDPLQTFQAWLRDAEASEPNDPNAAALATASADGTPNVRMVLVKRIDERGFCFFTNAQSQKGRELLAIPQAALCFHWKSLRRQVRVSGSVADMSEQESDEYFHSRSRRSQVGAAVSQQSRLLANREEMEEQVKLFAESHPGEVPRPSYWRGFRIVPRRIEFWVDGPDRLHDRILFLRDGEEWKKQRLWP
jgi:pyridoxamine 5'-phosphate oxidase